MGFILGASSGYGPATSASYASTVTVGFSADSSAEFADIAEASLARPTAAGMVRRYGGGASGLVPGAISTFAWPNDARTWSMSRKVSKKS